MKRGDEFKTTLFPPKTDHAAVVFDVNIHSVNPTIGQVTFEVDGASHTYRNEPEQWLTVTWPGKTPHGARLRVRGGRVASTKRSRGQGTSACFGSSTTRRSNRVARGGKADGVPDASVATWDLRAARDGASVSLDLRPVRNSENPLAPGYFKNYNRPRLITSK